VEKRRGAPHFGRRLPLKRRWIDNPNSRRFVPAVTQLDELAKAALSE
jgi:hypothetical protein